MSLMYKSVIVIARLSLFWHQEKNVTVRFTNRKHCLSVLRNRKKLMSIRNKQKNFPDSRFFLGKNLTPMNSKIAFICRE